MNQTPVLARHYLLEEVEFERYLSNLMQTARFSVELPFWRSNIDLTMCLCPFSFCGMRSDVTRSPSIPACFHQEGVKTVSPWHGQLAFICQAASSVPLQRCMERFVSKDLLLLSGHQLPKIWWLCLWQLALPVSVPVSLDWPVGKEYNSLNIDWKVLNEYPVALPGGMGRG